MSKIDELIAEYCPDGVEYLKIEEVIISLKTGLNPRKNFNLNTEDASNYYITVREINGNQIRFHEKTDKINDEGLRLINNRSNLEKSDVLFSGTGTIGRVALVKEKPINWNVKEGIYILKPNQLKILPSFLLYLLNAPTTLLLIKNKIVGSPVSSIPMSDLKKISIPIPPLPVQEEIVKILDKFTQLEAELEAELEARTSQYEYYRNQLLAFEGKEVERKTLGEVAHYSKKRVSYELLNEDNYVGVENLLQNRKGLTKSNYVPSDGNLIEFLSDDILIGNIRPYLKKIWKAKFSGGTNGDVLVFRINEEYLGNIYSAFLYHLLASDKFFTYNMQFAKGAKMPRGDKDSILKYIIPIPALEEQERIVKILDQFDAMVNDISIGLPAEIKARREQYEYYRGKLLTFLPLVNS